MCAARLYAFALLRQVLLFSDTYDNIMYAWNEENGVRIWRFPSGRQARLADAHGPLLEPGTNGLLNANGLLLACSHGVRGVTKMTAAGTTDASFGGQAGQASTILALAPNGLPFNSPNDLTLRADGTLYFTDPSYGLKRVWGPAKPEDSPGRQQSSNCVYFAPQATLLAQPAAHTLTCEMAHPNGIGLTASGNILVVGDSSRKQSYWNVRVFVLLCLCSSACTFQSHPWPGIADVSTGLQWQRCVKHAVRKRGSDHQ